MSIQVKLSNFQAQVRQEILDNILPFYIAFAVDHQRGGFYGYVGNDLTVQPNAPKGLVQHSRMLWTSSQAYRMLDDPVYLDLAGKACDYILTYFWDNELGGLF